MIASGAPGLLANGTAAAPYMISLYVLAIGAGRRFCENPMDVLPIDDSDVQAKCLAHPA